MSRTITVFGIGILLALLAIGGFMASRAFFVSADPASEPREVVIDRVSPTAGEVTFTTDKPVIASLECSSEQEGTYALCGAETVASTNHKLKTSVILDPEKDHYFYIKIQNTRYDNFGKPLIFPKDESSAEDTGNKFPTQLLGVCQDSPKYVAQYDINNDGCIRLNDRALMNK